MVTCPNVHGRQRRLISPALVTTVRNGGAVLPPANRNLVPTRPNCPTSPAPVPPGCGQRPRLGRHVRHPVQMHRWDTRLRPPPLAEWPVLWGDATDRKSSGRDGMPSRGQLRGPGWRRAGPGLYVRAATALTPTQRIVEGACLLPGYGAVGGWAAAYWSGMRLLDGLDPSGHTPLPVLLCLGRAARSASAPAATCPASACQPPTCSSRAT